MSVSVSTTEFEPYEGKPDKKRLIATYKGEKTDRVPNFEILIEDQHVTKLLGREAGNTLSVGGDVAKGADSADAGAVRSMYPKDYIEICNIIGQDCILAGACLFQTLYEFVIGMHDCMIMAMEDENLIIEMMERIMRPALDAGIPLKFHSDGKLDQAMEMLIDMGFDCINPMDPYGIEYRIDNSGIRNTTVDTALKGVRLTLSH